MPSVREATIWMCSWPSFSMRSRTSMHPASRTTRAVIPTMLCLGYEARKSSIVVRDAIPTEVISLLDLKAPEFGRGSPVTGSFFTWAGSSARTRRQRISSSDIDASFCHSATVIALESGHALRSYGISHKRRPRIWENIGCVTVSS